ncbi:MAG: stage III sporulation protein AB [Lachnospiraceae bacterium]|nr:stage III sporulation protein AB [Lachnospiraceae bacterium]
MLRILGSCMILSGFWGMGIMLCKEEEQKLWILSVWKLSLQILCNEIAFRQQPVIFALKECADKLEGEVGNFYQQVNGRLQKNQGELLMLWKEELNRYLEKTKLRFEEKRLIEQLENILGYEDQKMQLGMLQMVIESMDNYKKEAEKEKKEKKKVLMLLSTCSGVVMVLLLI